jgi:L-ascorbate metabolism protein UlaG (beta-lactamase superfamily)
MVQPTDADHGERYDEGPAAAGAGGEVGLTWLGHSTTVIDLGPVRVVTDPILRRHLPPLRRRGTAPYASAWRGAAAVLLSHLHHDHADLRSLRRLGGVPVYTSTANARWLRSRGLVGVPLEEGRWHPLTPGGEVEVALVHAVHRSRPMPHRPNDANGHLLRTPEATIWVAGDTSLYDGIADLPDLAGTPVDLAVVPIGGWGSRLSGGHMGPREAAEACAMVGARTAMAVHWGTLHVPGLSNLPRGWIDRPGPAFADELAATAPGCTLLDVMPGDATRLPPRPGSSPPSDDPREERAG